MHSLRMPVRVQTRPLVTRAPARKAPSETRRLTIAGLAFLNGCDADGRLLELESQRRQLRPLLASLAAAFLALRSHELLGFRCVGDWSRERLGIGARALREWARVWKALIDLPILRDAVQSGHVSWSVARKIARLATVDNEAACVETVRGRTARAVDELLRAVGANDARDGSDQRVRVAIASTPRVAAKWTATIELARRMSGEEIPTWAAAEAAAAEATSTGRVAQPVVPRARVRGALPSQECGLREKLWPRLRWRARRPPAPTREIAALGANLDSCDARELDRRFRLAIAFRQRIDIELGRVLRQVLDRKLYRDLEFESFERYVVERLDLSSRSARRLVRIARAEHRRPEVAIAFRAGRITLLQAEALLRGGQRVAWAERVTLRRLEDERAETRIEFWAPPDVAALFLGMVFHWGLEPLLDHALVTWLREGQRFKDYADFGRDGYRCTVPGCTARRNLQSHHIRFRSAGGADEAWNRTTLCAFHHLRGVHGGRVRIWGRAPEALFFALGIGLFRSGDVRAVGSFRGPP